MALRSASGDPGTSAARLTQAVEAAQQKVERLAVQRVRAEYEGRLRVLEEQLMRER